MRRRGIALAEAGIDPVNVRLTVRLGQVDPRSRGHRSSGAGHGRREGRCLGAPGPGRAGGSRRAPRRPPRPGPARAGDLGILAPVLLDSRSSRGAWSDCARPWAPAPSRRRRRGTGSSSHGTRSTPIGSRAGSNGLGRCLRTRRPSGLEHVVTEALALWRGEPLGELHDWDVARIEAEPTGGPPAFCRGAPGRGRHPVGPPRERAGLGAGPGEGGPLREHRWVLLATAQYHAGRQSEALATLRRLRSVL